MALKMTVSNHTTYDGANIKNYFFNHNYLHLFSIYYIISNGPAGKKEESDTYKNHPISQKTSLYHRNGDEGRWLSGIEGMRSCKKPHRNLMETSYKPHAALSGMIL